MDAQSETITDHGAAGGGASEPQVLDLLYAANIREDWEGLSELVAYSAKRRPTVTVLTNALENPIPREEQVAYRHALEEVEKAFRADGNFSDIGQFIESFRHDPSESIEGISARTILNHVEIGKREIAGRLRRLDECIGGCPVPFLIVPGPFESIDVIRDVAPPRIAERYLSVRVSSEGGFRIAGIGGLPAIVHDCPAALQDREYFEGTSQADEDLEALLEGVDVLVSFAPVRHFTKPGEEAMIRKFISERLPGKLILTSQTFDEPEKACYRTASEADLVWGGNFGLAGGGRTRLFWEFELSREVVTDKSLFELRGRKSFRLI